MKRRQWIYQNSLAALGGMGLQAAAAVGAEGGAERPTRVIDTHTHFYDPTREGGVPWPPQNSPLHRPVYPDDWAEVAAPHGVGETIVVEASPLVEDNQWILDLAAQDPRLIGLVGNLDPNAADFAANVKRFAANPKFRGVRWRGGLVNIDENPQVILGGARLLAEHGLELDLNGPPSISAHAEKLAAAVPDLRVVINHLGSAGDPQNISPQWKDGIAAIAQRPNVFMKVSALVEQTKKPEGQAPHEVDYYLPILDYLWQQFGSERLIFGSNWPVSDRGAPYAVLIRIVQQYFQSKGPEALENYFWRNATRAYGVA